MKKVKILGIAAVLLVLSFSIYSCKKDRTTETPVKQDVTFSYSQQDTPASSLKAAPVKADAKAVYVTITDAAGTVVYNHKKLDFLNFSGSFISTPISLVPGSYKLTEFLVVDLNDAVIFATPIEGSALAYLVSDPLPINFTVTKDLVTKVVPEVLSTLATAPINFGYASFDFNIIQSIGFLTCAQVYNPTLQNWELTTANVSITGTPGDVNLFTGSIPAITSGIAVKDNYTSYTISVSKTGYTTKVLTLTNAELKTYISNPLIFLLFQGTSGSTVTDIDGNVYNTVTIGTQIWMVENLKVTRYRNGDPIPNVTNNPPWAGLTTGAYCWYNNDISNKTPYGALYNWYAVADPRNIAPVGWHVPTDAEWTILTTYLGNVNVAGGKMKETGTTHWASPNLGATNSSGFTALPGGSCGGNPSFFNGFGDYAYFWSSTQNQNDTSGAYYRALDKSSTFTNRTYVWKFLGASVRLVKD